MFLGAGLGAACGLAAGVSAKPADAAAAQGACLDYGRSFFCNRSPNNSVRFWIESRTTLIDGPRRIDFYQCGACKSENTFAEKDLFKADNYDFTPIWGDGLWLIFRRTAALNPQYRRIQKPETTWGPPELKLRPAVKTRLLETWPAIRDATAAAVPIVAQTEIHDAKTGLRAVIECPVKTMNIHHPKQLYQVDTGPVALPDLSRRYEPTIDCLRLAFVAFNAPGFADFVVEQPAPVVVDGRERCQIHHYSGPITMPAKNRLLAVDD
jgi:hypothetical protein